jgi:hypothetical protein
MDHLAYARDECEWELADTCLEKYRPVVQSITDSLARAPNESNVAIENTRDAFDSTNSDDMNRSERNLDYTPLLHGMSQIDWFDEPWEYFWLEDLFPLADQTPPT